MISYLMFLLRVLLLPSFLIVVTDFWIGLALALAIFLRYFIIVVELPAWLYMLIVTWEVFHFLTVPSPPLPVPVMPFAILLLWALNIVTKHFWNTDFFDKHQFRLRFLCALLIWATGVIVKTLYGVITGA